MPYETATPTWSEGITLTADEDWFNAGPGDIAVTREAMTGSTAGGVRLKKGQAYPFNNGDTVRFRAIHGTVGYVWREQV